MQSANLKEIKAALWEQAFLGGTRVTCPMGRVVRVRRRKGQLLAHPTAFSERSEARDEAGT